MKRSFSAFFKIAFVAAAVGSLGCTEPGEMTGIGAAAGGVTGAALGAIVGNQTGDAGGGLVIGAMAGAGAGAAIGNALQAQDEAIKSQDEAIERQDQVIRAQQGEISELRRLSQDNVRFRPKIDAPPLSSAGIASSPRAGLAPQRVVQPAPSHANNVVARVPPLAPRVPSVASQRSVPVAPGGFNDTSENAVGERTLVEPDAMPFRAEEALVEPSAASQDVVAMNGGTEVLSDDCKNAESELQAARDASDAPERLLHYRRALRLCPTNAAVHSGLGDVYLSLNRGEDAAFEYSEALKLDPQNAALKHKLAQLKTDRY